MQLLRRIAFSAGLACFLPVFAQRPNQGDLPVQPGVGFSLIGIGPGETARLNVLNHNLGPSAAGPEEGSPPPTCQIALRFYDINGQLLKERLQSVDPGKATFLDLARSDLPGSDTRVPVRAVLNFGYRGGANPPVGILQRSVCNIFPSLEVFESDTKKTRVIITDARPLPGPSEPLQ